MRRFYIDIPSLDVPDLFLPAEESKHACKVLRMTSGDKLELVNGKGELLEAEIETADPRRCFIKKTRYTRIEKDQYHIHVAIAPTKMNDRFETFLEKATELGIHEITPILCSNSERKKIKEDRYNKVIIAAIKQSKRVYLPKLNPLVSLSDFLKNHKNGLIAHCEEGNKSEVNTLLKSTDCPILIGPEGDFTQHEIELALKNGYKPITLGSTRLRTETAGLYACMLAKMKFDR